MLREERPPHRAPPGPSRASRFPARARFSSARSWHVSLRSGQRQIVAMDHLVAATIAGNGLDFDRAPSDHAPAIGGVIGDKPTAYLAAILRLHHDRVAAMEFAGHGFAGDGK